MESNILSNNAPFATKRQTINTILHEQGENIDVLLSSDDATPGSRLVITSVDIREATKQRKIYYVTIALVLGVWWPHEAEYKARKEVSSGQSAAHYNFRVTALTNSTTATVLCLCDNEVVVFRWLTLRLLASKLIP